MKKKFLTSLWRRSMSSTRKVSERLHSSKKLPDVAEAAQHEAVEAAQHEAVQSLEAAAAAEAAEAAAAAEAGA
jgi:hypothetical protein